MHFVHKKYFKYESPLVKRSSSRFGGEHFVSPAYLLVDNTLNTNFEIIKEATLIYYYRFQWPLVCWWLTLPKITIRCRQKQFRQSIVFHTANWSENPLIYSLIKMFECTFHDIMFLLSMEIIYSPLESWSDVFDK